MPARRHAQADDFVLPLHAQASRQARAQVRCVRRCCKAEWARPLPSWDPATAPRGTAGEHAVERLYHRGEQLSTVFVKRHLNQQAVFAKNASGTLIEHEVRKRMWRLRKHARLSGCGHDHGRLPHAPIEVASCYRIQIWHLLLPDRPYVLTPKHILPSGLSTGVTAASELEQRLRLEVREDV